ncbi:DUF1304 domain-containing protein [Leucobacter soli]|uniref:DUF1304 domain-containing protein n=1 Tax=Leucobacter soli TaxID=2812850 RepID=A0A916K2F1_9MICO|nr:DUF1304 domain-containing protein [Leucobacter soli]CAG7620420.1 hypothetical protein LEUCIP111803_02365 [Leucobacter soli]
MIAIGLTLTGLAALIHVGIFFMESLAWESPRVRRIFGTSEESARATKLLAFNQGFYNLFLAVAVVVGIVLSIIGHQAVGATLVFVGAGSMVAAALVLLCSSKGAGIAALVQGLLPAFGIIALAIGVGQ